MLVTVSTDDDDVIVWSVCPTYRNRLTLRAVVLAGIDENETSKRRQRTA